MAVMKGEMTVWVEEIEDVNESMVKVHCHLFDKRAANRITGADPYELTSTGYPLAAFGKIAEQIRDHCKAGNTLRCNVELLLSKNTWRDDEGKRWFQFKISEVLTVT